MTTARDHLSKADTVTVAGIEGGVSALVEARALLDRFHAMVRRKSPDLEGWIDDTATSLLASFAAGISKDKAAVTAAIASPWSNGQIEGHITKLKLVKRQMYGWAKPAVKTMAFAPRPTGGQCERVAAFGRPCSELEGMPWGAVAAQRAASRSMTDADKSSRSRDDSRMT